MPAVDYLSLNGRYWDEASQGYREDHPAHLDPARHPSWSIWNFPETRLRILIDDVPAAARLVDLGCGIGHDVVGFATMGHTVHGIEWSIEQHRHALPHENARYLHAPAERLPLANGTVDAVYSDHGAFDFSPAARLLPEVNRVLTHGGILAVCTYSPLLQACFDGARGSVGARLHNDWGANRAKTAGGVVVFNATHAEWIYQFTAHGFEVQRLEEVIAPPGAETTFGAAFEDRAWATRWPAEDIWVLRKRSP